MGNKCWSSCSLAVAFFAVSLYSLGGQVARGQHLACEHRKPEGHSPERREGDGGFRLIIQGAQSSRDLYLPNHVYTVSIEGLKTRYSNQKFTEFLLVAESDKQAMMGPSGLVTTGIFHIMDDSQTRFSDVCPDGVTSLNRQPKSEISVRWTAPSVLVASCVTFKATVVERPHMWYMDDGQLTKTICPEMPGAKPATTTTQNQNQNQNQNLPTNATTAGNGGRNAARLQRQRERQQQREIAASNSQGRKQQQESRRQFPPPPPPPPAPQPQPPLETPTSNVNPAAGNPPSVLPVPAHGETSLPSDGKCCACDDAKYDILFEGIWSKETHPKDFPENEWLLHFSDIIGASHATNFHFWKEGEIASEGVRHVAEWGATRQLENELKQNSGDINTIIKARGLWHPNEKGVTSAAFRVDRHHPKMSLVSMIGPSPDWLVGIFGIQLCLPNCTWIQEASLDLFPYDAGTDSGITYMSPNTPTEPREPIRRLTSRDPPNPRSPFYDGGNIPPFAKVILRRQRIYAKSCDEIGNSTSSSTHEILLSENTDDDINRPECAVTDWTSWSACSVTCGKGLRMRKRHYTLPTKADMFRCDRQLVEKEMCLGALPTCPPDDESGVEEIDSVCAVSGWTEWSPCSVTCGEGTKTRHRRYRNHMGRKKCSLVLLETQTCRGPVHSCHHHDPTTPTSQSSQIEGSECPLSPWSEWSPCSVSCGTGVQLRSRVFLPPDENPLPQTCDRIQLSQRIDCLGEYGSECKIPPSQAREICVLQPDPGPCRGNKLRFHFNGDKGMCVPFNYGGCKGNRNRFDTEEDCNDVCGFLAPLLLQNIPGEGELSPPPPPPHPLPDLPSFATIPAEVPEPAPRVNWYSPTPTESPAPGAPATLRLFRESIFERASTSTERNPISSLYSYSYSYPYTYTAPSITTTTERYIYTPRARWPSAPPPTPPPPVPLLEGSESEENLNLDLGASGAQQRLRWKKNTPLNQNNCARKTYTDTDSPSHEARGRSRVPVSLTSNPEDRDHNHNHESEPASVPPIFPEPVDLDLDLDLDVDPSLIIEPVEPFHFPPAPGADHPEPQQIDCVVSPWREWSPCSVTCDQGFKTRARDVLIQPQNGGKRCPRKTKKKKSCVMPPC